MPVELIRSGIRHRRTAILWTALGALALSVLLGATLGCDSSRRCSDDEQCPTGFACRQNQCLSIVSGRTLGVEILPPSDSMWAETEYPNLTFEGTRQPLYLDTTTQVSGLVDPGTAPMQYSADAHVQVTIQSRLPGRSDLQIGTEMAMNQFKFGVGTSRLNTIMASFLFTPGATNATNQPPIPITLPLTPTLQFTFPDKSKMTVLHGQLVDDQGNALAGYLARAYQGTAGQQQVSNTFPTMADGTFALLIPLGAVPYPDDTITLTLTPPANPTTMLVDLPQFQSNPVSLKTLSDETMTAPHVYTLPAFVSASSQVPFTFTALADDKPQSGVSMRFTMSVPVSADGNAYFQASATSNSDGIASVPLVPGTVDRPVAYQVMVQGRDTAFAYASLCVPALPFNVDAAGTLPVTAPFTLKQKVQLSGTISDSKSAPAVGATVTVTQTLGVTDCGAAATPPPIVSATTGSGGDYKVMLDPGTYRLEVDPPPASMVTYPRTILDGANAIAVGTALVHNITLPEGNVAMGTVYAPDQVTPVPGVSVEIFEVFCRQASCGATQPPVSLGLVQTDMMGNFQTILPATLP